MAIKKIKVFERNEQDPFPGETTWPLRATIELLETLEQSMPADERATGTIKDLGNFKVHYSHMLSTEELYAAKVNKAMDVLDLAAANPAGMTQAEVQDLVAQLNAIL